MIPAKLVDMLNKLEELEEKTIRQEQQINKLVIESRLYENWMKYILDKKYE